ncbi:hypothetical protein N0V90_001595 [Kalmusia sp. IMI 367209]|nr:hypothetical protein N0V90_001595 [Kalmusia sp. IMI 367209]
MQPNAPTSFTYPTDDRLNNHETTNAAPSYIDEPSPASSLDPTEAHADTDLESNGPSQLLGNGLGRVVLGRAELVINLVGSIGTVIVIIKLSSIVIPLHLRVSAIFMITSWALVQILYLVADRHDADLADMEDLFRRTMDLERKLNHSALWTIITLLLLPIIGYLTFVELFESKHLPWVMSFVPDEVRSLYFLFMDPLWWYFVPRMLRKRKNPVHLPVACHIPTKRSFTLVLFHVFKFAFFFCFGWLFEESVSMCKQSENIPIRYYILPFSVIPTCMAAWMLLPGVPFMRTGGKGTEWLRGVSLFYNITMTAFFFTGAMMLYDEDNTYKPDWLEWFGKLHRS